MTSPILIVEDDRKIANVVRVYLENAGFHVVHVERGKDAIEFVDRELPLLVILDLMLPDTSGEEVCQEMREYGDFPIIMLTSKSSEEERIAGFALGADDYIVKPFSPRELVYRVKAILKRYGKKDIGSSDVLSFDDSTLVIDGQKFDVIKNGESVNLTSTEFRILYAMASSPGKVFSREELIEKALGYRYEGYDRVIDAHIKNIRKKLGEDPKSSTLIQTVYGVGYRFAGTKDA